MTTCVSTWYGRGERPPTSHVSATSGRRIGLTPEVSGCARLNHRLTSVVTTYSPLASNRFNQTLKSALRNSSSAGTHFSLSGIAASANLVGGVIRSFPRWPTVVPTGFSVWG